MFALYDMLNIVSPYLLLVDFWIRSVLFGFLFFKKNVCVWIIQKHIHTMERFKQNVINKILT